ncbi:MAG: hypothetical protein AB9883_03200 [Acidaminococcaceae bacterium]
MNDLQFEVEFYNAKYLNSIEKDSADFDDLYKSFHIKIYKKSLDDLDDNKKQIGYINLSILEVAKAMNNGWSAFDVTDSINQEWYNVFYEIIDQRTGDIKDKYFRIENSVLYLEWFYIFKNFRGQNYAKRIMKSIDKIVMFLLPIDFGLMVLHATPIEYDEIVNENGETVLGSLHNSAETIPDFDERTRRLLKLYKSAGFKNVKRGRNVMIRLMPE